MNTKALCAVLLPAFAVAGLSMLPQSGMVGATFEPPSLSKAALVALAAAAAGAVHDSSTNVADASPIEALDLQKAVEQGLIHANFSGNGRETMRAVFTNTSSAPVAVKVPAGQLLESGRNMVVVVRTTEVKTGAGQAVEAPLQTASVRSTNEVANAAYTLSYQSEPRLRDFLDFIQERSELTQGAIQTAVLALIENLPLNAVAKFTPATGDLKSRFNTDAFRVETFDIVTALSALKDIGVPDAALALTIDPQLKIEAMIEPLSRTVAMRYYELTPESEWEYWKKELLAGEPATRHYALYGIARFYPDVALEMLPRWAREAKTTHIFRLTAIQALSETNRPAAVTILHRLAVELGTATELGSAALGAAHYLDARLTHLAAKNTIAFRASHR